MNATWPFAKLRARADLLTLQVNLLGTFHFQPSEVVALQPYTQIPVLGEGVRIVHRKAGYKQKIIFWTFGNPRAVIAAIEATGFRAGGVDGDLDPATLQALQQQEGQPFRPGALLLLFALWLVPFFGFVSGLAPGELPGGPVPALAFAVMPLFSLLCLSVPGFARRVLKPGRTIEEVRLVLWLMGVAVPLIFSLAFWAIGTGPA
ncbi:MAG: hypothetical protein D6722_05825 [Bacteroidetes bacterium]|nr:MAG: hypothetical protein D6722_05825 [Bacteroidota bacterium]